jgi:hypothetical protein
MPPFGRPPPSTLETSVASFVSIDLEETSVEVSQSSSFAQRPYHRRIALTCFHAC